MAQWEGMSLLCGRIVDRISLRTRYLFLKLCIYQTSLQKYFGPTGLKLWSIFLGKILIMKWNFCLGDLGGYGIAYQPPAGPHFRPRALPGPWAKMGTLGRLVCNSISTQVTQAEISFHFKYFSQKNASKFQTSWSEIFLQTGLQKYY